VEVLSAIPPQPFNPTAMSWMEGSPVVRSPQQLRLHRALQEVGWAGVINEFNEAAGLSHPSVTDPILITTERDHSLRLWALAVGGFRWEV
jgi:hypothetical protein